MAKFISDMEKEGIRIEFGIPEHGWIDIAIIQGEKEFRTDVSDVPFDPLEALIDATAKLAKGIDDVTVTLFEEPRETELRFRRDGDYVNLTVISFPSDIRQEKKGTTMLAAKDTHADCCLAFWRAIRRLESEIENTEFERNWSYPFPAEKLSRLTRLLKE